MGRFKVLMHAKHSIGVWPRVIMIAITVMVVAVIIFQNTIIINLVIEDSSGAVQEPGFHHCDSIFSHSRFIYSTYSYTVNLITVNKTVIWKKVETLFDTGNSVNTTKNLPLTQAMRMNKSWKWKVINPHHTAVWYRELGQLNPESFRGKLKLVLFFSLQSVVCDASLL